MPSFTVYISKKDEEMLREEGLDPVAWVRDFLRKALERKHEQKSGEATE